jgi:serpin B
MLAASASITDAVATADQRLAIALMQKADSGSNVTVSPASLYFALGMLQNAARGRTAAEISAALQAEGMSTDDQNAGLAALTHALDAAAAKDGLQLDSANSIWQQRGFAVRPQFLAALDAYYRTGLWQVDFDGDNAGAVKALNAWTSDHTHGKITKLFDQLDPTTVLVLANAMYFHANWATPFDQRETIDGTFIRPDGTKVTATFMSGGGDENVRGVVAHDYQAVESKYAGGRFAALAVMPTSGSLKSFVDNLTPDRIDSIASSVKLAKVSMPRFTTRSTLDLKPLLQALGMRDAFTEGVADLSGLSDAPTVVDQVVQRTYLSVGEKGTTAAAATGVAIDAYAANAPPSVLLDHPFVFLVRDTQTGAILFASEVTDPTAG